MNSATNETPSDQLKAGLPFGVANHRRFVSLSTIARCQAPTNRPAPPAFSFIMVRCRRWLAAMKIARAAVAVTRHHYHP